MTADLDRDVTAELEGRLAWIRERLEAARGAGLPSEQLAKDVAPDLLGELELALDALVHANERVVAGASAFVAAEGGERPLFESLPVACLETDAEGRIERMNPAASGLLGGAGSTRRDFLDLVAAEDRVRLAGVVDGLRADGAGPADELQLRLRRGDGRCFLAAVAVSVRPDASGRATGLCWVVRDLTEGLHRARIECERREREACRLVAGGVIHHLNNLLASIRGYAEMLAASPGLEERGHRAVQQIALGTERGERLTSQLMAFARSGAHAEEVGSIGVLVGEACEVARLLLPESVEVVVEPWDEPLAARVDGRGLYQTVLNLILNARDALVHGGEIRVETRPVVLDEAAAGRLGVRAGSFAAIRVVDTGGGMRPEVRDRALEPFFSTKAIGDGFGLGLATAEAIVREAEGAIELESESEVGTRVTVLLPLTSR